MIKVSTNSFIYNNGKFLPSIEKNGFEKTISYKILSSHNDSKIISREQKLRIKFDTIASHDITYVGIIQTAKAIGLQKFPIPYVLTNCHNSLCAVGGTINEDDHSFGLSAAKKYGGIYVPANQAVIHTYIREEFASPSKMILGSDSHTRYGALGTMGIGEGGPEIVKQIISSTYDVLYPEVIAIHLTGKPRIGVGPQDVAILLIGAVFKSGFVKNKVLEFVGEGIKNLSLDFRNGIDVMTTETACLSSIWETDEKTRKYLETHGRASSYIKLSPDNGAYYDGLIEIDLDKVEPMIAMPFHPSNAIKLSDLLKSPKDILGFFQEEGRKLLQNKSYNLLGKIDNRGKIKVDQAIIAGCAGGTFENIFEASNILEGKKIGPEISFSVYAGSIPTYLELLRRGSLEKIISSGGIIKNCFCGPCFGAGDVPANNSFSIRHTTRNFENREGSKPSEGQIASVALMDARSIAATAANNGILSSALDYQYDNIVPDINYDKQSYSSSVYNGFGKPISEQEILYGPNITEWPTIPKLADVMVIQLASVINDAVTTTDELIPSGEASSYRSNPLRLAEYTLSRKDPNYVTRAKETINNTDEIKNRVIKLLQLDDTVSINVGSAIYAKKPGDGSAREQAASSQRVLGGVANIAKEYATKRYRSNMINWGMLPFLYKGESSDFSIGDIIVIVNPANFIEKGKGLASLISADTIKSIELELGEMTFDEKATLKEGCLINFQRKLLLLNEK